MIQRISVNRTNHAIHWIVSVNRTNHAIHWIVIHFINWIVLSTFRTTGARNIRVNQIIPTWFLLMVFWRTDPDMTSLTLFVLL